MERWKYSSNETTIAKSIKKNITLKTIHKMVNLIQR